MGKTPEKRYDSWAEHRAEITRWAQEASENRRARRMAEREVSP